MAVEAYSLIKRTLDTSIAIDWLYEDSKDDFYPDPYVFRDVHEHKSDYLSQREHRLLQIDVIPSIMEYMPKATGMLREAIWLHPTHRVLYLAVLHFLLPKLDKLIPPTIYSYRLDQPDDPNAYPFPNRLDRWKQFHNHFRSAALEDSTQAIILADLAAFYDHISVDTLAQRIEAMLGCSMDDVARAVVQFLRDLLNLWSPTGYGIPQNLDPSSFFGSLYLYNVDAEMLDKRYRYFRWVDDIRICAKDHDQAVRALHDLQRALSRDRLFLASDKTRIIEKGSKKFEALVDVEDDAIISKAEEDIATGYRETLSATADTLLDRLRFHASSDGNDRKFRAYANRLLSIAEYEELSEKIHPEVRKFVSPRLRSHPSRSDYWTKMLLPVLNEDVVAEVRDLLINRPSLFDWQRFHLWRMLTHCSEVPSDLLDHAKSTARVGISMLEQAQAIVCAGKHGTNVGREQLFGEHFSAQTPYPVQRALIIAIQELPKTLRDKLFERALQINSDHQQLVDFLRAHEKPNYGERPRPTRHCREEPREISVFLQSGVGLIKGKKTTFRLSSSDYDY